MKRFGKFRRSKICSQYALYDPYAGKDCFHRFHLEFTHPTQRKFNRISPMFDSIKHRSLNSSNVLEWIDVYSTSLRKAKVNRLDGRSYCKIN